jgi:ABC-type protease/lipase transport system fused ATPase/permease subunit
MGSLNLQLSHSRQYASNQCLGAFLLATLYLIYLVISFAYHLFLAFTEHQS